MDITPGTVGEFCVGGNLPLPPTTALNPKSAWRLNHSCLRIRDPSKSLQFYMTILGMRIVFNFNAGPFTIYFLGYPKSQEHQGDLARFSQETVADMGNYSLLELLHVHGSEKESNNPPDGKPFYENGNEAPHLGFGHIGLVVPSVEEALKLLKSDGVEIVKEFGIATKEGAGLTTWEEQRGIGMGEMHPNYEHISKQIAFIRDPVSVLPSSMKSASTEAASFYLGWVPCRAGSSPVSLGLHTSEDHWMDSRPVS